MNKVIEADFLPRETNVGFSWSGSARSGMNGQRRILIVDDDHYTTHMVKVLLERTGHYLVLEENDATKGHQTARNFRPDLILLDIMMPEADGGEVAAQIEADPELQNTPIIFLTALVTRVEAKAGLQAQGHSLVAKPVSIPELINSMEGHFPVHEAPLDLSQRRDREATLG